MSNKAAQETTTGKAGKGQVKPHIKKYDFKRPKLVSKEVMRGLRKIHDLFARHSKRIFSNALGLEVGVELQTIEPIIFDEFLTTLTTPTALFLFKIEELDEWSILQINTSFCIFLVECQSGGRTMELKEPRNLTRIEEHVMNRIIDKLLTELTHIWAPYVDMTIQNHIYESRPNGRAIMTPIPGIKATFKITVEDIKVPFRICYPYAPLKEELMNSFGNFNKGHNKKSLSSGERIQFKNKMKDVNITAHALLGESNVSVHQLLNLTEGDVIRLDQHIDQPLKIKINNKLKMNGYPGLINGNKAIKIFDIQKNNEDDE